MLSSTEAVSSAKANNIISNLRNLKTAALAFYADNLANIDDSTYKDQSGKKYTGKKPTDSDANWMDKVVGYMSNGSSENNDLKNYGIKFVNGENDGKGWWVYYSAVDTKVQTKLAGRASSVGLYGGGSVNDIKKTTAFYSTGGYVGMWVVDPVKP